MAQETSAVMNTQIPGTSPGTNSKPFSLAEGIAADTISAAQTPMQNAVVQTRILAEPDWWSQSCAITCDARTRRMALTNFAGRVYPTLDDSLMARVLHIAPHERVLDIGGGDAPFGRASVVTDAFPDMNAHRSGRSARVANGVEFVQCFAEELPFADKAFDVAYCRMVLEHAIDPAAACREMMRVAQRGFLETPSPLAEYLGGHPTHRWIVRVERLLDLPPTLVFRRKPYRRAPLSYALRGPWFTDVEFRFNWEWRYRNLVCTQFMWEGEFAFRVEEDAANGLLEEDAAGNNAEENGAARINGGEQNNANSSRASRQAQAEHIKIGRQGSIDYDDPLQAAEAHLNAAISSLRWGDVPADIILPDAEYAVSLCPDDAFAHNTLGCALWSAGRREAAQTAFRRAADLEPQNKAYAQNALLSANNTSPNGASSRSVTSRPASLARPHLVTLEEALGVADVPGADICAVTHGEVDLAARLLLSLPPAPRPVSSPIYARLLAEGKGNDREQGTGNSIQHTAGADTFSFPLSPFSCPLIWNAPLRDPSGYADEARHFLFALDAAGANVAARAIRWSDKIALLPADRERVLGRMLTRNVQASQAVQVCHILAPLFQPDPRALANVGRTMFETDRLPPGWADACNRMDAVWVPSAFNVTTFVQAGVRADKLRVVPGAIDLIPYDPGCAPLRVDGARGFNFLSVFDWTLRKGWDALIRAYVEEFGADEDVALILKTHSSLGYTGAQMLDAVAAYITNTLGRDLNRIPDIILQDANVPDARMPNLYRAADCYVMPSRGEGWGRPYMEAMAMGLPVIATGWSGQTAFLNAQNSLVLDYTVEDVPDDAWRETPTYQGHQWAEPSPTHLRSLLRRSFEDRQGGKLLGQTARAHLETHFTYAPVAAKIASEIQWLTNRI